MKNIIYFICLSFFALSIISCNGKPERPDSVLNETQKAYTGENDIATTTPTATPTPPPPTNEPPQNSAGVWHYTCSAGCAGGAGSAVPCGTCGATLVHNTAYHNTGDKANPTPVTTAATDPGNIVPPPPAAKTPEPPQNAAGVWHYTCSAGCAGGAGSAVPCGTCGSTLVHNTAYHDKT